MNRLDVESTAGIMPRYGYGEPETMPPSGTIYSHNYRTKLFAASPASCEAGTPMTTSLLSPGTPEKSLPILARRNRDRAFAAGKQSNPGFEDRPRFTPPVRQGWSSPPLGASSPTPRRRHLGKLGLPPRAGLDHRDHAGVGTLELVDAQGRLASWRYTWACHRPQILRLREQLASALSGQRRCRFPRKCRPKCKAPSNPASRSARSAPGKPRCRLRPGRSSPVAFRQALQGAAWPASC